mmetsp:Transcript_39675/g.45169  ORF Transcript_39675/g.45169 Transcript_39675/m.45169 type:complete len:371 (-) Transcript_39675:188-1300(-)
MVERAPLFVWSDAQACSESFFFLNQLEDAVNFKLFKSQVNKNLAVREELATKTDPKGNARTPAWLITQNIMGDEREFAKKLQPHLDPEGIYKPNQVDKKSFLSKDGTSRSIYFNKFLPGFLRLLLKDRYMELVNRSLTSSMEESPYLFFPLAQLMDMSQPPASSGVTSYFALSVLSEESYNKFTSFDSSKQVSQTRVVAQKNFLYATSDMNEYNSYVENNQQTLLGSGQKPVRFTIAVYKPSTADLATETFERFKVTPLAPSSRQDDELKKLDLSLRPTHIGDLKERYASKTLPEELREFESLVILPPNLYYIVQVTEYEIILFTIDSGAFKVFPEAYSGKESQVPSKCLDNIPLDTLTKMFEATFKGNN